MNEQTQRVFLCLSCTLLLWTSGYLGTHADAQMGPTFSVDWQGPTNLNTPGPAGLPDGFAGLPIDEGSILTSTIPGPVGPNPPLPGPLPPPGVMVGALPGAPGSLPGGLGIVPSLVNGALELDALSYGRDRVSRIFGNDPLVPINRLFFSVDEFAAGLPMSPFLPDVSSEGVFGTSEASADVFNYLGVYGPVPGMIPPGPWNVDVIDGNGVPPFGGPGTGLIEPNPPTLLDFGLGDPGDNLDAVDVDTSLGDFPGPIYFSLDSNFPDFLEVPPGMPGVPNNATALSNGFVGGDILVSSVGGAPALYIPAFLLGLDLFGPDSDDLDALALMDNGDGVGLPGAPGSGLDEILFSVRRGSAVIGTPDSAFGIPIEEGDVLTAPTVAGAAPSIFVFAEQLGLATVRSGTATLYGIPNPNWNGQPLWADDLNALDVVPEPGTIALLWIAAAGLAGIRHRRSN